MPRPFLPACLRDPYIYPTGPRPRPAARLLIPHAPLTDAQWAALVPHLPRLGRGRPCDTRAHFDAFFRLAATEGAWRDLPPEYGNPQSLARHFRRLTHAGVWERLLTALAAAPVGHPLREMEGYICRAARRAIRLRGLALIVLARRLKLLRALPGPPWMVADPALSEIILTLGTKARFLAGLRDFRAARDFIRILRHLHTLAGGRAHIPRCLKEAWR